MKIKIKDFIRLSGCYSAHDVGEKEIDLPDKNEIREIIKHNKLKGVEGITEAIHNRLKKLQ